jgi:LPXTG-motif cell wall-anchored protein
MTSRRLVGGAAAVGIVAALSATTAAYAQPTYPPSPPTVSVSATSVPAGSAVTLTGSGFLALSTVTIAFTVSQTPPEATTSSFEGTSGPAVRPAARILRSGQDADGDDSGAAGEPDTRGWGHGGHLGRVCTIFGICRARVNGEGSFSTRIILKIPGYVTIVVRGYDPDRNLVTRQVVVHVLPRRHHHHHHRHHHHVAPGHVGAQPGEPPELPYTGAPVWEASVAGLGLVLLGTVLAVVSRRRRAA